MPSSIVELGLKRFTCTDIDSKHYDFDQRAIKAMDRSVGRLQPNGVAMFVNEGEFTCAELAGPQVAPQVFGSDGSMLA